MKTFGDKLKFPDRETMTAVLNDLKEKFPRSEPSRVATVPPSYLGDFPQPHELECSFRVNQDEKDEYIKFLRQQDYGEYSLFIRFMLRNQK